jgi:hypothetical protein
MYLCGKQTRSGTWSAMPSLEAAEPPYVHQPCREFLVMLLYLI